MSLILIIILSMFAGSALTLLALCAIAACLEQPADRQLQYPFEMTGRSGPLIH